MNRTEELLNQKEINYVIKLAENNPNLKNINAIGLATKKTDVCKISPKKEIIFIEGNSDTGFKHIHERHSYWSPKHYWKIYDDEIKLDAPSKFDKEFIPIFDYAFIVDELFLPSNLNIEKNKRPNLFEMYSGTVNHVKYHMLLYRNTKILHTLYPHNKKNNKKKVLNYIRQSPKGQISFKPKGFNITVSYNNQKNDIVFSIKIIRDYESMIEKILLIHNVLNSKWVLNQRQIKKIENSEKIIKMIGLTDFSKIEKEVKKLEKEKLKK
jgi:hypothetical protein